MVQATGILMVGCKLAMQQWKNWHSGPATAQAWHRVPTPTPLAKHHTVSPVTVRQASYVNVLMFLGRGLGA